MRPLCRGVVALTLLALAGTAGAEEAKGEAMYKKIIGMYVHQHWSYNHPYAARTWSLDDWRGYMDGLKRIGYNTVLIWPVLETMPNPLTESDRANLEKVAKVIEMGHKEFGMRVYVTISPNAAAKDEEARKYTFQDRPFFYTDRRVNVEDPRALGDLIAWRKQLFEPIKETDGVFIIDSDPGGYPGSTNIDFAYLLNAHRVMFDELRPGIELYYWIHVGWESYCKYYETGHFEMGGQEEVEDAIRLLAREAPEPWGLASGRGPGVADALGMSDRVMSYLYGAIEGEPSFPMSNFGGTTAYDAGKTVGARGGMGNSQTHCIQLANAFAFVRGAQGLPCEEADYVKFAEELIPGQGAAIVAAWKAGSELDPEAMDAAANRLAQLTADQLNPGVLKGLLFNDPQRFVNDLVMQLRLRAALERFHAAVNQEPRDTARVADTLEDFVEAASTWQGQHGYKNMWWWPRMDEALVKLNSPAVDEALARKEYRSKSTDKTPFEQVQEGYYLVETYTPHLIEAMRQTVAEMKTAAPKG